LIFQTLDDKQECVGIYCNNNLYFDNLDFPKDLSTTWKYSGHLRDRPGIEYANLYIGGKDIKEIVPEYLKDDWEDVSRRLSSFRRSLQVAKVNLQDNCLYDLVPKRFLIEMCEVKNKITEYVLENYQRPERYSYLLKTCQLLEDISHQPLNINKKKLRDYSLATAEQPGSNRLTGLSPYIKYNQFGTKTGRLTTKEKSFPILTLKKGFRDVVNPHNDYFLELDFNGAEVRVMMGILDMEQPSCDVHKFHAENVFGGNISREEVKKSFFAWLYGSKSAKESPEGKILEKFYDKEIILDKHWDGKCVHTPFRKKIEDVDEHHALNYIVQSTAAELTFLQALKIHHLLQSHKSRSRITCIIHDAIIIDFDKRDERLLASIKKLMSSTKFGEFKINISKGTNLGNLKEHHIDG
jgi:hypothetical protein